MIRILASTEVQTRLIREIIAPLGREIDTYTPGNATDSAAPELGIVWWDDNGTDGLAERLSLEARRMIIIAQKDDEKAASAVGADALFIAPFRAGQITDRARTFLNPAPQDRLPEKIQLSIYDFYPRENRVHDKKSDINLRLTDKERDILLTLHQAAGKAVSRQDLLDAVWAYAPGVETHTLETHIYRLRQKIEKDPADPQILLTDEAGYKI